MKFLRVATLGGEVKEYAVADGTNLFAFLRDNGYSTEGLRVEFGGQIASATTAVNSDGTVVLTPQVKGGSF